MNKTILTLCQEVLGTKLIFLCDYIFSYFSISSKYGLTGHARWHFTRSLRSLERFFAISQDWLGFNLDLLCRFCATESINSGVLFLDSTNYRIFHFPKCLHRNFSMPLNVIYTLPCDAMGNLLATKNQAVFFTTDLEISTEKLLENYGIRYQIEFNFRDVKQYFGLNDFKG